MRDIVDQLERSIDSGNYYLSLFMALALPDIAGALDSDDGLASKAKYIDWYERWGRTRFMDVLRESLPEHAKEHISDMENPMDGESCYLFRCSMLHQGKTVHPKNKYSRIIFIEPGSTTNVVHYGVMNDALCIDLPSFCKEMILGVRMWLDAVESTDQYQKNYKDFVHRHPGGLKPGIPGSSLTFQHPELSLLDC